MDEPSAVMRIEDSRERALAAHQLIDRYQAATGELSRVRRDAIEDLLNQGMTQTQVADLLDVSRSRVSQLLSAGSRPERAFLGTGRLIVAIGGKREASRRDPGDLVSAEALGAYHVLADLAKSVGLDTAFEVVPPPGNVHLNRSNLIVLTAPRLLPFLSQIIEADSHLRFASDNTGWYVVDVGSGTEYRSPRDRGENADYGFIGRLPRPDGKGTFLYLAGIHSQGTLGAARYVYDNIGPLYRELKNRRFSTLVSCRFKGQHILSVEAVTPLYRAES